MAHKKSYIICATPRSGTTLLCDLLADTGVAGRPDSFFRRQSIPWWTDYLNVPMTDWDSELDFDRAYLAAVLKEGAGGTDGGPDGETGVFGMRLMRESAGDLLARLDAFYPGLPSDGARFEAAFGPPLYVHLTREDKVAQAVSRLKAEQSGLWHVNADGSERERLKPAEAPAYDADALAGQVAAYEEQDAAWASWFAREGIEPLRITYEALSSDPQAVLARILSALGLNPAVAETVKPRTAKLSDQESRDWTARFQKERRGLL